MLLNIYINRFFAVTVVVLMLGACSQGENPVVTPPVTQGGAVSFVPTLSKVPVSTFVTGDKLGVLAYATDVDGNWNKQGTPELMYNTELTKIAAGNFTYDPIVYYPTNGNKLKFFAYYPHAATAGDNGITLSPKTQSGYPTVDFDASVGSYGVDMMAAVTESQNSGSVTLNCQHVLTKVNVSAKSAQGAIVSAVKIIGINSKGQLSMDNYTNKPAAPETWWANQNTAVTIGETVSITTTDVNYTPLFKEPKMVIPQAISDLVIEISYMFSGDATPYTKQYTQDVAWVAGGSVNYQIDILPDKVSIAVSAIDVTSMRVWGYSSSVASLQGATPIVNMNPAQVSKSGNIWAYAPIANWVNGKFHTFVATAPATANVTCNNGVATYTNPAEIGSQIDLRIASMKQVAPNNTDEVQFSFSQALTPVRFVAKVAADVSTDITDIVISKIVMTGSFVSSASIDLAASPAVWVAGVGRTASYTVAPTKPASLTIGSSTEVLHGNSSVMMAIPQVVGNIKIKVSVSYNLKTTVENIEKEFTFVSADWQIGQPYTFELLFTKEDISADDGGGTDPFG